MATMDFDTRPYDEPCLPAGWDTTEQIREGNRMITMVKAIFPGIEKHLGIRLLTHNHEIGFYALIRVSFGTETGAEFAYFLERNWPNTWGDTEIREFLPSEEE